MFYKGDEVRMSAEGRERYSHNADMNPHDKVGKIHSVNGGTIYVDWGGGHRNCYVSEDLEFSELNPILQMYRAKQDRFLEGKDFSDPELVALGVKWGVLKVWPNGELEPVEPEFSFLKWRHSGKVVAVREC